MYPRDIVCCMCLSVSTLCKSDGDMMMMMMMMMMIIIIILILIKKLRCMQYVFHKNVMIILIVNLTMECF